MKKDINNTFEQWENDFKTASNVDLKSINETQKLIQKTNLKLRFSKGLILSKKHDVSNKL